MKPFVIEGVGEKWFCNGMISLIQLTTYALVIALGKAVSEGVSPQDKMRPPLSATD